MKMTLFTPTLLLLTLALPSPAMAALSGGVGVGGAMDCRSLSQYISKNWFDLRSYMSSDFGTKKPSSRDFRCLPPEVVQGHISKPVLGHSGMLQCFGRGSDPKICCDRNLQACVQYSGD